MSTIWLIQIVDEGCLGTHPSIALDGQDVPHISYFIDRPPANPDYQFTPTSSMAIGLGDDGLPVIVYNGESDLKVAEMDEEYWTILPLAVR